MNTAKLPAIGWRAGWLVTWLLWTAACAPAPVAAPAATTDAATDAQAALDAAAQAETEAVDTGAQAEGLADGTDDASRRRTLDSQVDDADALAEVKADIAPVPKTVVWVHHPQAAQMTLRGSVAPLSWTADFAPAQVTGTAARFDLPPANQPMQIKARRKDSWAIGANHVVQPEEQRHMHPFFDPKVANGRRENFTMPGPFGGTRTLRTWLPPGYDENTAAQYPLLLMMDGQNLFEDETASFGVSWKAAKAALAAYGEAKLGEVIIVGIDHAGAKRIHEYTPWPDQKVGQGGGGVAYAAWLQASVLPELTKRYRLLPEREARVLGGSSLGALISLYALVAQQQTWGGAVCMSGAWWWQNLKIKSWVTQNYDAKLPVRIWLDAGDVDDGLEATAAIKAALEALGIKGKALGYHVAPGANHSEAAWAARVHLPLQYFFDPGDRAKPF